MRLHLLLSSLFALSVTVLAQKSFKINCEENRFELDGKPFRYIGSEVHYYRIPRPLWRDRLLRIRAIGANLIQTYVAWNYHEDTPGKWNFKGNHDVRAFIKLAESLGFHVNLRVGPYICSEWEQGGLPWWLLGLGNIELRTNKEPYLSHAKRFISKVAEQLADLQYPDGPILMVQLENEYGYIGNNHEYVDGLFEYAVAQGFNHSVFYTTDGKFDECLAGGHSQYAYPTLDFGTEQSFDVVKANFELQKKYAKCGPAVNSEFYPGWYTSWGKPKPASVSPQAVVDTLTWMNQFNASWSFLLVFGGTNWGFWNGANSDMYATTSYEFEAPLTEAAQVTEKYLRVREFIQSIPGYDFPDLPVPTNHSTFTLPNVQARRLPFSLPQVFRYLTQNCKVVEEPEHFEKFGQGYGYAIYEHKFANDVVPAQLTVEFFRDILYIYIGDQYQGALGNCTMDQCHNTQLKLNQSATGSLYIIAENLGRLDFGVGLDKKGIRSSVQGDGQILKGWTECGIQHEKIPKLVSAMSKTRRTPTLNGDQPGVYWAEFPLNVTDASPGAHTFIDAQHFGKGQFFLNGVNVGRYWPDAGPLTTLYAPALFFNLNNGRNNRLAFLNFAPRGEVVNFDLVEEHHWIN